jgi:hypothetical protein
MKRIILLFMIFLSLKCFAQVADKITNERLIDERIKLKNYAFCQCLRHLSKSDSLLIKDGSAASYFETGAYNIYAYEMIDSITKNINLKSYKSKEGKTLIIMKCLDFYNSKELDKIIEELDKELIVQRLHKKQ